MRGNPPGTVMKQRSTWPPDHFLPIEGDYLVFDSGACYQVLEVKPRREGAKSVGMVVVKLEDEEIPMDQSPTIDEKTGELVGLVHPMEWTSKYRR